MKASSHLRYEGDWEYWSALRSDSSGLWSWREPQAAEEEWASTEAWTGTGRQEHPFPGPLLEIPPGPDWQEKRELRSGEGLGEEAALPFGGSPLGKDAGSLTGSGPPPSLSDQHSAKPDVAERYRNGAKLMTTPNLKKEQGSSNSGTLLVMESDPVTLKTVQLEDTIIAQRRDGQQKGCVDAGLIKDSKRKRPFYYRNQKTVTDHTAGEIK